MYIAFFYVFDSPFPCGSRFSTFFLFFFFYRFTGCQCILLRSLCGSSCLSAIGHNRKRAYPHTRHRSDVLCDGERSVFTRDIAVLQAFKREMRPLQRVASFFFFFFFWFRRPSPFCSVFLYFFILRVCFCCIWDGKHFFVSHANALVYSQCARPCVCECFRFYYCAGVTRFVNISRVALVLDFP